MILSLHYILLIDQSAMQEHKEPMSGKKLFGVIAAVMIGAVVAGLVLFTNFL
jgi:hypothetical protein